MAFDADKLAPVGPRPSGGIPWRWIYKTEDALTVIDNADYFLSAITRLKIGDIIDVIVVTNIDASNEALADAASVVVNANDGTTIDTTDVTDYITTDAGG